MRINKYTKLVKCKTVKPENRAALVDELAAKIDIHKTEYCFYDLNYIDTSIVNSTDNLFVIILLDKVKSNINFDVSEWDVSNVIDMDYMFYNLRKFDCDISNWDVSNVIHAKGIFKGCYALIYSDKLKHILDKWSKLNNLFSPDNIDYLLGL